MCDEYRFGTLERRVGGHDSFTGMFGEGENRFDPLTKTVDRRVNLLPNEKPHVSGDLLVAAATRMQLQRKIANLLCELQLHKVMNVFDLAVFGFVVFYDDNSIEAPQDDREFVRSQDACCGDRLGVRHRCTDLLLDEPRIEGKRTLPFFKRLVQRLAEAAGPHLASGRFGLSRFVHLVNSFSIYRSLQLRY